MRSLFVFFLSNKSHIVIVEEKECKRNKGEKPDGRVCSIYREGVPIAIVQTGGRDNRRKNLD